MSLDGEWHNELGSVLTIDPVQNGEVTGVYATAVSASGCAHGNYRLVGRTDTDTGGEAVAFVVCWKNGTTNCESVTAWSGQLQTIDGHEVLTMFWLLTVESTVADDWFATHVGEDVFRRTAAPLDEIARNSKTKRRAHP